MFYDKFKVLAIAKGVSVHKATQEIGLSKSTATKWKKTGATPSGDTLQKIADYFNVSVDFLLTGEESIKKEPSTSTGERFNAEKLSVDEIKLIELYRQMSPEQRELWTKVAGFGSIEEQN